MTHSLRKILASASVAVLVGSASAHAQSLQEQMVGTWTLVSDTLEYVDGTKEPSAPGKLGQLMIDKLGNFSLQWGDPNRPKVAGEPAANPTGRYIAYFGTMTANDADKTLVMKITRSAYPNFDGTEQKRQIIAIGDQFSFKAITPLPSAKGPMIPVLVWQRAK